MLSLCCNGVLYPAHICCYVSYVVMFMHCDARRFRTNVWMSWLHWDIDLKEELISEQSSFTLATSWLSYLFSFSRMGRPETLSTWQWSSVSGSSYTFHNSIKAAGLNFLILLMPPNPLIYDFPLVRDITSHRYAKWNINNSQDGHAFKNHLH